MRILLVDDNALLRGQLARAIARMAGTSVDEASGVAMAFDLAAANAYDVVISDEEMGDGFGHEVLERIAVSQPRCRRVLMSGAKPPERGPGEAAWERFFAKPDGLPDLLAWLKALPANP